MPVIAAVAGAVFMGAGAIVGAVAASAAIAGIALSTILTVTGVALMAVSYLAAPKPKPQSSGQQLELKLNPNGAIPIAYGRTATGGNMIWRGTWGSKNKYLGIIAALSAGGPIQGIESFRAGDYPVSFSTNPTSSSAAVTSVGDYATSSKLYKGKLSQRWQSGAAPASQTYAQSTGQPFPAAKLSGIAHALTWYEQNQDAFPQGIPASVWVIKGVQVYDPRRDGTFPGGSGGQRRDDPATWKYSENPFLAALQWALGRYENGKKVYGIGARWSEVDVAAFVTGANVADANGWKVGGVVTTDDDKYAVLATLLAAGGGVPIARGAQISCSVNAPKTSVMTLKQADVIGEVNITSSTSWRGRSNVIVPKYREETQNWQVIAGERVSAAQYVTEDGGETKTVEIEFPLVQQAAQAHQLAAYELCNSREFLTFSVVCRLSMLAARVGDCLTIELPDLAASSIKCQVIAREFNATDLTVTLTLKSETDAKHPFALGQSQVAPPAPALDTYDPSNPGAPGANAWAITDTSIESDAGEVIPMLILTGVNDDPNTQDILVEYRPLGSSDWLDWGSFGSATTRIEIGNVTSGTQYQVAIRYRTRLGVASERLVLGAVLAGQRQLPYDTAISGTPTSLGQVNAIQEAMLVNTNATANAIRTAINNPSTGQPYAVQTIANAIGELQQTVPNLANAITAANNALAANVSVQDALAQARALANTATQSNAAAWTAVSQAQARANEALTASNSAANFASISGAARDAANAASTIAQAAQVSAGSFFTIANAAAAGAAAANTAAQTALTLTQGARDAAQTAANTANSASSSASNSATLAIGARDSAAGWAGAALQHSNNASTSANSAAQQASVSTTQATLATTARGEASTFANTAASAANSASGYASAASQSSGVAAASASLANISSASLFPDRYDGSGQYFTQASGGSAASVADLASNATASNFGPVYERVFETTGSSDFATRGLIAVVPSRTYRLEVELQRTATTGTGNFNFFPRGLGASYTATESATSSVTILDGTVQVVAWTLTTNDFSASVWIRPSIRIRCSTGTMTVQVRRFSVRDLTESTAANSSAIAASVSSQQASIAANTSAQSASASSNSATLAQDHAAGASVSRQDAANFANSASGSSSNASTSATLATNARNAADDSANAAAVSATTASSHASNAAGSSSRASSDASLAAGSANTAAGHSSTALTYRNDAANSASNANSSASAASTSAGVASAARTSANTAANAASTSASQASSSANTAQQSASASLNSATLAQGHAGTAATYRQDASNFSNSASGSAASASTSANTAASASSTANTAANAATTSASQASASANNAGTSANAASLQASIAASNAATAYTYAQQAGNSATDAGGSASRASSNAGIATNAANTASGHASNALVYRNDAANSASNANASSSAASTSAGVAASSEAAATNVVTTLLPSDFALDGQFFGATHLGQSPAPLPSSAFTTVEGIGRVFEATSATILAPRGLISPISGRKYRASVRIRCNQNASNGSGIGAEVQWFGTLGSTFTRETAQGVFSTPTGSVSEVAALPRSAGWIDLTVDFTPNVTPNAWLRPRVIYNVGGGNSVVQVAWFKVEDVTAQDSAAGSATAAATSASSASTSANAAQTSANAASASQVAAATDAGLALVYRSDAANSSTSANSASSNASTSAGLAVSAAGQAANSAAAGANSATTAQAWATNAGQQATIASNASIAAGTSASAALSYRNDAANASTSALGNASNASTSAGVASSSAASANLSAALQLPERLDVNATGFYRPTNTNTQQGSADVRVMDATGLANIVTDGTFGLAYSLPTTGLAYLATRAHVPAFLGRVYEVTAEINVTAYSGTPANFRLHASSQTSTYTIISTANRFVSINATGVQTMTWRVSDTAPAVPGSLASNAWAAGALWLRFIVGDNTGMQGSTVLVRRFSVRDITAQYTAAGSATAAATSASSASTSANSAQVSANAASTSQVSAAANAALAAVHRSDAANSSSTANTAASNASTSAALAVSAANNAGNSAVAGANSATTAQAWATNAGQQASIATNAASVAGTAQGAALVYRNEAANSATLAGNSASAATMQAGLAANSSSAANSAANAAATSASAALTSSNSAQQSAAAATNASTAASTSAGLSSASANVATTQSAAAVSAKNDAANSAAAALASQTISASVSIGALNPNPVFTNYTNMTSGPGGGPADGWAREGTGGLIFRSTGELGIGNAMAIASNAGGDSYAAISTPAGSARPSGYYVVEADVKLTVGSLVGSGVLMRVLNNSNATLEDNLLQFAVDPDSSKTTNGAGVLNRTYRFRKLIRITSAATVSHIRLYAMSHWSGHGPITNQNELVWYKCAVRPASDGEIAGGVAIDLATATAANVSTVQGAVSTLQGKTSAWLSSSVNAGSDSTAFVEAKAETSGGVPASTVAFGAREIHLYNQSTSGWTKALSVVGGNAIFSGGLQAGTFIRLGSGAGWPVALASQDYSVTDGTVVTFPVNLGKLPALSFSSAGLAPLTSGETYKLYAQNLTATGFTARLKITTAGAPVNVTNSNTQDTVSGTPRWQMVKTEGDSVNNLYKVAFSIAVTMPVTEIN